MDPAPGIDFVEVVLALESVDGKGVAEGGADGVIADLLLEVECGVDLVAGVQDVAHDHRQDHAGQVVLVEVPLYRLQTGLVVARELRRQQLFQELGEHLLELLGGEGLLVELEGWVPLEGRVPDQGQVSPAREGVDPQFVQGVVLVLGTVQEYCPLTVEGHASVPQPLLPSELIGLILLAFCDELFEVDLADVAEEEVVESTEVGVGSLADDAGGGPRAEEGLEGGEQFLGRTPALPEPLDLHQLLELLLDLKVVDRVLLETAVPLHQPCRLLLLHFQITLILNISMSATATPSNAPSPFRDIINRSLQAVYAETEDLVVEQLALKTPKRPSGKDADKERECDANGTERIVHQGKLSRKPDQVSARTVDQAQPETEKEGREQCDNPEWAFTSESSTNEVARIIRLESDFKEIVECFLQTAYRDKLMMCQDTDSFVTVKKGGSGSCRCIVRMWWYGADPEATVYQLRRYGRKGQKAKLILVDGQESTFHRFYFILLRQLEIKKLVKLQPSEKVQLIFNEEIKETSQCSTSSETILKRLARNQYIGNQELQALTVRLQNEATRLKIKLHSTPGLVDLAPLEKQMEDLCYRSGGVLPVFQRVHAKQYEGYRGKREQLLKGHPISEIFRQLEITEHFNQFKRQRSLKEICTEEKIPYMSAIQTLKQLAESTSAGSSLKLVLQFRQRIRNSYTQYFKSCLRLGDMDDYLPVTIFCVLAVDSESNWLGTVKWLLGSLEGAEEEWEMEKKTLTDLEAAFEYIVEQWPAK